MEAVSYFFSKKSDHFLDKYEQIIKVNFQHLLENTEFTNTVRFATGDKRRVIERFTLAQQMLGGV